MVNDTLNSTTHHFGANAFPISFLNKHKKTISFIITQMLKKDIERNVVNAAR